MIIFRALKTLRDVVARENGKIRHLFFQANRIYYVVGIFFAAYKIAQVDKISITKALSHLQGRKNADTYEEFYHMGLELLKQNQPQTRSSAYQNAQGQWHIDTNQQPNDPNQNNRQRRGENLFRN